MAAINKTSNEYAAVLGRLFDDMPKAVVAAIAVSALTSGGDNLDDAATYLVTEWSILHNAGIVPQSVPAKYRHLIDMEFAS